MLPVILWYFAISLIGLLAFPLAHRMLPALPDRGYAFSRALGLLLWSFAFWLLSSYGALANNLGGLFMALFLLIGVSAWALRGIGISGIVAWLRENRRLVLSVEAVFLAAFAFMVLVRASNPDIFGTEKPMELAFINASIRAPAMPPHDPWLSGYAISYYYLGYVQTAMMAQLTGVSGGIAFNLQVALVFALTAAGAYGLVYNLLAVYHEKKGGGAFTLPLLGPLFVLLVGNAEGFLEILHARHLYWSADASGTLTSRFWRWLGILELNQPPTTAPALQPRNFESGSWWWWRASRVIQDYDWIGRAKGDIISEFPAFSFILADLHPHVLVLPFALVGIALALNLFLGGAKGQIRLLWQRLEISPSGFVFAVVVIGALPFLNIWEFPLYVGLFAAAYVFWQARGAGWGWARLKEFVVLSVALIIGAMLAYLPYYVGFDSQAGGLLPNLLYPTRGAHLWVIFATLWIPIIAFLVYVWRGQGETQKLVKGLIITLILMLVLLAIAFALTWLIMEGLPRLGEVNPLLGLARTAYLDSICHLCEPQVPPTLGDLVRETFRRRVVSTGGWITLGLFSSLTMGLLWPRQEREVEPSETEVTPSATAPSHIFTLLLILFGTLLVIGPEFLYLRDVFGYRINTIFKFYFQAWLLWGLAAAYGSAVLLTKLRGGWNWIFTGGLVLVLAVGLTYSVFGFWDRARGFTPQQGYVLDGTRHTTYLSQDDAAAVAWLKDAPLGTLVEAVGGSYSNYARISAHSGQPALLGWPGHEAQWRGGGEEMGSRAGDISRLYSTPSWEQARQILQQYDIRYVYLGPLERTTYQVNERKFIQFLTPVFQSGAVTIYQVPDLE